MPRVIVEAGEGQQNVGDVDIRALVDRRHRYINQAVPVPDGAVNVGVI